MIETVKDRCIHCHICRDNCSFLSKYGLDIGDTEQLKELAYSCFLCGKCTEVCPAGIDGRNAMLQLRRDRVAEGDDAIIKKNYKMLVAEKEDYKFRNYRHANAGTVFFPGCNFPSMYPKTNNALSALFAGQGIGTVYDCCGKPIAEIGLEDSEHRIIERLQARIDQHQITEIVTACPNCMGFLKDRLNVKLTTVYDKLMELGLGSRIPGDIAVYTPCPDRKDREWLKAIEPFVEGSVTVVEGPICCGLGGCAAINEPELSAANAGVLEAAVNELDLPTYVYCASCAGKFKRSGLDNIDHVLSVILETGEKPDTVKSYVNRTLTRFK